MNNQNKVNPNHLTSCADGWNTYAKYNGGETYNDWHLQRDFFLQNLNWWFGNMIED